MHLQGIVFSQYRDCFMSICHISGISHYFQSQPTSFSSVPAAMSLDKAEFNGRLDLKANSPQGGGTSWAIQFQHHSSTLPLDRTYTKNKFSIVTFSFFTSPETVSISSAWVFQFSSVPSWSYCDITFKSMYFRADTRGNLNISFQELLKIRLWH